MGGSPSYGTAHFRTCAGREEERAHKRSCFLGTIGRRAATDAFTELAVAACAAGDLAALKCIKGSGFGTREMLSNVRTLKLSRNLVHVACELPQRPQSSPSMPHPIFEPPVYSQAACIVFLKELGCEELFAMPDQEGRTPAHIAASTGHVTALRALIQGVVDSPLMPANMGLGDVNQSRGPPAEPPNAALVLVKDAAGCFPAHLAAQGGHTECIKYIHSLGAEAADTLDAPNEAGETAAGLAFANGHQETTRALALLGLVVQVRERLPSRQPASFLCSSRQAAETFCPKRLGQNAVQEGERFPRHLTGLLSMLRVRDLPCCVSLVDCTAG